MIYYRIFEALELMAIFVSFWLTVRIRRDTLANKTKKLNSNSKLQAAHELAEVT